MQYKQRTVKRIVGVAKVEPEKFKVAALQSSLGANEKYLSGFIYQKLHRGAHCFVASTEVLLELSNESN